MNKLIIDLISFFLYRIAIVSSQEATIFNAGMQYDFYLRVVNFPLAISLCKQKGSHLAIIYNDAIQKQISAKISEFVENRTLLHILPFDGYWIGGKQVGLDPNWFWLDGNSIPVGNGTRRRFSNWHRNEPQNRKLHPDESYCLFIAGRQRTKGPPLLGKWFSKRCQSLGYTICQKVQESRKSINLHPGRSVTSKELALSIVVGISLLFVAILCIVLGFLRKRVKRLKTNVSNLHDRPVERRSVCAEENGYISPLPTSPTPLLSSLSGVMRHQIAANPAVEPAYLELDEIIDRHTYANMRGTSRRDLDETSSCDLKMCRVSVDSKVSQVA